MRSGIFRQSRWAPDTKQTSDSIPTKTLDDVHACGLGRALSRLTAITTHFEGCVKQPLANCQKRKPLDVIAITE